MVLNQYGVRLPVEEGAKSRQPVESGRSSAGANTRARGFSKLLVLVGALRVGSLGRFLPHHRRF